MAADNDPWRVMRRQYLESRRARGDYSCGSRTTARYVLNDLADHLAGVDPHAPPDVIVDAVVAWADRPAWSVRTRGTNLGYVRPMFNWASLRGRMTPGISAQLPSPRRTRSLPRALNTSQVGQLLGVVPDDRARVIVLLEGQCGLRRAEVAGVDMADLDLLEGAIRVTGKGAKTRIVYPSEETLDAIRAYLVVRGGAAGALVCHEKHPGRRLTPTWIGILVSQWMADAGLKTAPRDGVSGHALRHSTATNMLRAGANIRVVQEAMGHESILTTAVYLRADNPEVRAAMRVVDYGSKRLRAVPGG